MQKRKCRWYIHIIALFTVAATLFFANDIAAFLCNGSWEPQRTEKLDKSNANVVLGIDRAVAGSSYWERPFIKGWAYCATDEDNSAKTIQFILKRDQYYYIYDAVPLHERSDLAGLNGIRGTKHGFSFSPSTLNLPVGSYEIFVSCYENENAHGITQMKYILDKSSTGIRMLPWHSMVTTLPLATEESFWFNVDTCKVTDDRDIQLSGWAYHPDTDSTNQRIYVEVTDVTGQMLTMSTMAVIRNDLMSIDDHAINAGYQALIEPDLLAEGELRVRIILEYDGIFWCGPESIVTPAQ